MCTFGRKWKWSGRARDDYASVISDRKWLPKKRPVIAHIKAKSKHSWHSFNRWHKKKSQWEIPYSRKYWRDLNLAVGSQITILNVLADLNLAVRYGIVMRIYASKKFWRILIRRLLKQTAKPPNLIPRQNFWLYGIHLCTGSSHELVNL